MFIFVRVSACCRILLSTRILSAPARLTNERNMTSRNLTRGPLAEWCWWRSRWQSAWKLQNRLETLATDRCLFSLDSSYLALSLSFFRFTPPNVFEHSRTETGCFHLIALTWLSLSFFRFTPPNVSEHSSQRQGEKDLSS